MPASPSQQQLTLATVNQKVIKAQYAVRGAVLDRALELEAELEAGGSTLPFDKIVRCNIGNPQALGQKPLTFVRQVLCLVMNPELLKTKKGSGWAPSDVVARARAYLKAVPSVGAYTHSQGIQLVRDEVASMFEARDEFPCDANDIFLTEGASAGVKIIIDVLMREKRDAVLTPMPQYPLYSAAIALRGGTLAPYHLDESKAWGVNVATLRKALRRSRRSGCEVRAMVVINPGNPTGMTLDEPTMRGIVALCAEERLVLMADEVYQKNVYSAARSFISFKKVLRTMERDGDVLPNTVQLISFHSISKGFTGECGLRGGFFELIGFNAEVKQQMFKLASIGLCSGVPGQLVVGLTANPPREGDPSYKKYEKESSAILASLRSRQIKIVDALRELDGVTCNDADGAMYAFPRITMPDAALAAAEARDVAPDALYALELVEATGIVVVPGSGFGQVDGTHHIRITILPPEDELDGVLARLTAFHARFMANETHALADELVAKKAGGGGSGAVGSSGAKKSGPSKIGKMLRRTFVAFALFACFFALMKAGHQWMIFTVLLIQVELYREFTNVRYDRGLEVQIPLFRTFLYSCFFSTVFYMQGTQGLSALIQAVLDASSTLEQPALSAAIARVGDIALQHFEWIAFSLFAMSLVVFVISLRAETLRYQFKQLAWTCLALVIVCAQSTSFTPNILNGFFWFYVPATMVVGNDTLAYFGGFFLGKKVCKHYWGPKKGQRIKFFALSPNKTWEGFLTGAVFTLIWGFYFSRYVIVQPSLFNLWDPDIIACAHSDLRRFSHASASAQAQLLEVNAGHRCAYPEYMLDRDYAIPSWGGGVLQQTAAGLASVPYAGPVLGFSPDGLKIRTLPIQWHFILIGLFISLVAPFGGFFASGLKRAYGIKDFDSFLPGHGGLMDRLDCHLITGFMTRIHYMAFVVPFHTTIMKLLVDVAKLPAVQQHDFFNRLVETLGEDGANGGATCAALVG